jgi:hypothetical protein
MLGLSVDEPLSIMIYNKRCKTVYLLLIQKHSSYPFAHL